MPSLPPHWKSDALAALGAPVSADGLAAIGAWAKSTPLPPGACNPIGMPAGSSGAPSFLGTRYAVFLNWQAFCDALAAFAKTEAGKAVTGALSPDVSPAAVWRVARSLSWPGSGTETDYPSAVLDLAPESYRLSVRTADAADRKTSGVPGGISPNATTVLAQARSVHEVIQNISDARAATAELLRRHAGNG